ncbi:MAG: hypothetical protein AMXMBFR34_54540 [Myxococcaceae bacterium]
MPIHQSKSRGETANSRAARAESHQRTGKVLVVAGFIVTILGVVLYCAVTFAGGVDAGMGDILFHNAVPFARATLGVLGLGTLLWLVGSFTYLRGAMDADEEPGDEPPAAQ